MSWGPRLPLELSNPSSNRSYAPNKESITHNIYFYDSAIREANNCQRVKHPTSCLISIAQKIRVPHLMTCTTCPAVKRALTSEFGGAQTLINQKQAFMLIQRRSGLTAPVFAKRFYREAQILVTYGRIDLKDAVTAAVSSVASHSHFQMYLKVICSPLLWS